MKSKPILCLLVICLLILSSGIASATSYPYYSYEELRDGCSLVVSGQVISISESKWSTPDGKRPENLITEEVNEDGTPRTIYNLYLEWDEYIYTDAVFKIEAVYKGDLIEDEIVVRFLTGTADDWSISDSAGLDIQSYEEGKTYLFFLVPCVTYAEGKIPNHYRVVTPRGALMKQESSPLNQEIFVNFYGGQVIPEILFKNKNESKDYPIPGFSIIFAIAAVAGLTGFGLYQRRKKQ